MLLLPMAPSSLCCRGSETAGARHSPLMTWERTGSPPRSLMTFRRPEVAERPQTAAAAGPTTCDPGGGTSIRIYGPVNIYGVVDLLSLNTLWVKTWIVAELRQWSSSLMLSDVMSG